MHFALGGLRVPIESVLDFSQTYEPIDQVARLRMMTGAAVQQVSWRKLRTTLSGAGWWPAGLDALNFDAALVLDCAAPRSITSASNVIMLPPARRTDTDYLPVGYALVLPAGGAARFDTVLVPTPLALAGDTATLTAVSGAVAYQATYYPRLNVFADRPQAETDIAAAQHRWTLTAEEI